MSQTHRLLKDYYSPKVFRELIKIVEDQVPFNMGYYYSFNECRCIVGAYEKIHPRTGIEGWGRYTYRTLITPNKKYSEDLADFLFNSNWGMLDKIPNRPIQHEPEDKRQALARLKFFMKYGMPIKWNYSDDFAQMWDDCQIVEKAIREQKKQKRYDST
jgi:hypothetical protein